VPLLTKIYLSLFTTETKALEHPLNTDQQKDGSYLTCMEHSDHAKYCMQDAYVQVFADCVRNTRLQTGIELPEHIEHYAVALLAVHVDRADFLPKTTFAQALYNISNARTAKELGDTCLFVTGVFPEYGVNRRYYTDIGRTAYSSIELELFRDIAHSFDVVQTLINCTVSSQVQQLGTL